MAKRPIFAGSDPNGDGCVQTNEVQMLRAAVSPVDIAPDLALLASRVGTNAKRYSAARFTKGGAPVYDLAAGEVLARDTSRVSRDPLDRLDNRSRVKSAPPLSTYGRIAP